MKIRMDVAKVRYVSDYAVIVVIVITKFDEDGKDQRIAASINHRFVGNETKYFGCRVHSNICDETTSGGLLQYYEYCCSPSTPIQGLS